LLSLYAVDEEGGVPEPLLPPQIALQNPELIEGYSFFVLPALGQIAVMMDRDGDENYRPFGSHSKADSRSRSRQIRSAGIARTCSTSIPTGRFSRRVWVERSEVEALLDGGWRLAD
jgi:hypothetical protein